MKNTPRAGIMHRDFTLEIYRNLLETISKTGYATTTVRDYIRNCPDKCIILRHDVDREVNRSLVMAALENEYGIKSTYYFRHIKDVFDPTIMKKIEKMGHEIGFHYEVLDKAKGNVEKSIEIFRKELENLREVSQIDTICMHGNPLAPWSNLDLWETFDYSKFGIIAEPYLSINYEKVLYLTDTGRTWGNKKIRVKDVIKSEYKENITSSEKLTTTKDIIELIQKENIPQICILVHPNRWCDEFCCWTKELILQKVKNTGKAGIIWYRSCKKSDL
jgi:hypothetical protein